VAEDQGTESSSERSTGVADSWSPFGFAIVRGRSMLPTLVEGDRLLVRHRPSARSLRAGRLVVCAPPGRPIAVKRLGSRHDGAWWVTSDNAGEGTDSREFGPLPDWSVVALVMGRVWPRPSPLRRSAAESPPD
jgi:SOS-response transcriptional repressor LexA